MQPIEILQLIMVSALLYLVVVCVAANLRLKKPIGEKIILALISGMVAAYTFFVQGK